MTPAPDLEIEEFQLQRLACQPSQRMDLHLEVLRKPEGRTVPAVVPVGDLHAVGQQPDPYVTAVPPAIRKVSKASSVAVNSGERATPVAASRLTG